ncbi:hypothetical protein TNCV_3396141 [Trichonephila clavipes]|nr:hypothetical protein TNCV_3396141 [Trichonephila clavipes]
MDHPPYSPDLAPSDFHLFRYLKRVSRCAYCDCSETDVGIASVGKLPDLDAFNREQILGGRRMAIQFPKSSDS